MATQDTIEQLANVVTAIEFDEDTATKLIRANLGEESLEKDLTPLLDTIRARANFALEYALETNDSQVSSFTSTLQAIVSECVNLASYDNVEYMNNKNATLETVRSYLDSLVSHDPYFVSAAVRSKRVLERDFDVSEQISHVKEELQAFSTNLLKDTATKYDTMLKEAAAESDRIESRARDTAAGVSVKEAQKQFKNGLTASYIQVAIWGSLSALALVAFFFTLIKLIELDVDVKEIEKLIYISTLRIRDIAESGVSRLGGCFPLAVSICVGNPPTEKETPP